MKIRDAVGEFSNNLSDQEDRPPPMVRSTSDAEATSAVEGIAEDAGYDVPVLRKEDLPPEWRGEHPVLCVAGRTLIDEAAAIMLAQLSTAHGLPARVEGAQALSTTNIFRLDIVGVAIVCLIYMDASGPAHMRYSVRRLRRKLPKATIILGCWLKGIDPATLEQLREGAKADLAAASLADAIKLSIEATGLAPQEPKTGQGELSATTAA
jgi:hypothetical protein